MQAQAATQAAPLLLRGCSEGIGVGTVAVNVVRERSGCPSQGVASMNPLLRSVLAVLAGLVVCFVLILAIQALGMLLYPPPPGLDFNDREAMQELLQNVPVGALLLVLASYFVGVLAGSWVAGRLAGRAAVLHGLIIGVFFFGAAVVNLMQIKHPLWFTVASLGLFLPAAWLGGRLVPARPIPRGGWGPY
jgi:hypothetical protein